MRKGWVLVLAAALVAGLGSSASAATLDGDWSDWFSGSATWAGYNGGSGPLTSARSAANNWQGYLPPSVTPGVVSMIPNVNPLIPDGFDDLTNGASNWQSYDIEMGLVKLEGNRLWVGIVTGLNPWSWGHAGTGAPHFLGDVLFNFGDVPPSWQPMDDADIALGVAAKQTGGGASADADNQQRLGTIWDPAADLKPVKNAPADAIGMNWRANAEVAAGVGADGSTSYVYGGPGRAFGIAWGGGNADAITYDSDGNLTGGDWHNFLELYVDLTDEELLYVTGGLDEFGNEVDANWGFHWTMECGNDYISFDDPLPVPEPSSIALLGLGMLGVALRKRFWA